MDRAGGAAASGANSSEGLGWSPEGLGQLQGQTGSLKKNRFNADKASPGARAGRRGFLQQFHKHDMRNEGLIAQGLSWFLGLVQSGGVGRVPRMGILSRGAPGSSRGILTLLILPRAQHRATPPATIPGGTAGDSREGWGEPALPAHAHHGRN